MAKTKTKSKTTRKYKTKQLKKGKILRKEFDNVGYLDIDFNLRDDAPVEAIKGIGYKKGDKLRGQGIHTVGDLKQHFAKQEILAKVKAEKRKKKGFYKSMDSEDHIRVFNKRMKKIEKIKDPHERIRELEKLYAEADVIVNREGTHVYPRFIESDIRAAEERANKQIEKRKKPYKWVVLGKDGTVFANTEDKEVAVRVFRNAKKTRQDERLELHRYRTKEEFDKYQKGIIEKEKRKTDLQIKRYMRDFKPAIPTLIASRRARLKELLLAEDQLSGIPKSKITKAGVGRILDEHDIASWELRDKKGKSEWLRYGKKQIDDEISRQNKEIEILESMKNENKFNNTTIMLSDALKSSKRLKREESELLNKRLENFKEANRQVKLAIPESEVDRQFEQWKNQDKKLVEKLSKNDEDQWRIRRYLDERYRNWFGSDLAHGIDPVITNVLNDKTVAELKRVVRVDVDEKKIVFTANARKQSLKIKREQKRIAELKEKAKKKDVTNVIAFEGTDQQWIRLPHGQVIRIKNNRFAFAQTDKKFANALKEVVEQDKLVRIYDEGELTPEELYQYGFILLEWTDYANLNMFKEDKDVSKVYGEPVLMDKSRFVGMVPKSSANQMKGEDYKTLKGVKFADISLKESINEEGTSTYLYDDKKGTSVLLSKKTVDKIVNGFRKTRKSDVYPFSAFHFATDKPLIIDFAKADVSVLIAPMQPDEPDVYEEDEPEIEDFEEHRRASLSR